MGRFISQVGDSTDDEDYDESKDDILKLNNNSLNIYYTSYMLKNIGSRVLESSNVRHKYDNLKREFVPQDKNQACNELHKKLGQGWGVVINGYNSTNHTLEDGADIYFKMNKAKIDKACKGDPNYKGTSEEKANYYLRQKVNIQNNFKEIYKLNKEIALYAQNHRQSIEHPSFLGPEEKDASLFLARVKASKKLDRDLAKGELYSYLHGSGKTVSKNSITINTTQQNETLEVCTKGAFKHYKTDEGSYTTVGKRLQNFTDKQFIDEKKLPEFFQSYFKGKINGSVILSEELRAELMDQLQALAKLIFGIEVKRNTAALLTNAMFFDLIKASVYKIENIADKMPMAMESAVSASITIDKRTKEINKLVSEYDYRINEERSKAIKLEEKDNEILQDWLKLKLDISKKVELSDVHNKIPSLGANDLVKKLADMQLNHIDTSKCSARKKIQNEENIGFNFNDCKGTLRLEWNTTTGKYEVKVCRIQEVSAKVFYNLIKDWYGIELSCLNKDDKVILKAAAEPEDPQEDRDHQDDFKVSVIDEGKEEPETAESFEYNMHDNTGNSVFVQQCYSELIGAVS